MALGKSGEVRRGVIAVEVRRFLAVGAVTVAIDFTVYQSLLWARAVTPVAKAIGFVAGASFAYVMNRSWTFGHLTRTSSIRFRTPVLFAMLYLGTLGINVASNSLVLAMVGYGSGARAAGFLVATSLSATINFVGMKLLVFRPPTPR
jgi:Predicted membrane protein